MNDNRPLSTRTLKDAEQAMVGYLQAHPDFFMRHPELVETLRIPHPSGPAVSLIERQVIMLREQNARLRSKLQELVDVARDNGRLVARIQRLTLMLIEHQDLEGILQGIRDTLRSEFNADFTVLRLAAPSTMLAGEEHLAPEVQGLFEMQLHSGRPQCGRLTRAQARGLFGEAGSGIASAALVPLRGRGWCGLLGVGSRDEARFWPGMGTLFLDCMGELISHALQPHLGAANEPRTQPPTTPLSGSQD